MSNNIPDRPGYYRCRYKKGTDRYWCSLAWRVVEVTDHLGVFECANEEGESVSSFSQYVEWGDRVEMPDDHKDRELTASDYDEVDSYYAGYDGTLFGAVHTVMRSVGDCSVRTDYK